MERRLLTPPEAALLIEPSLQTAAGCVQAALLALVAAGRISFEPRALFSGPVLVLHPTPPADRDAVPRHLLALEQALLAYGKGPRLRSSQVVHASQKAFGLGYQRFVHDEVAASLIRRGLLTRTDAKWLGLIPYISYRRTPQGEAMAAPIRRLMERLERVPSLLKTQPDAALRLARSAGVLLVMAPGARRHLAKLQKLVAARGEALVLPYVPLDESPRAEWEVLLELGDLSLSFDVESLLDAVGTVGDFTGGDGGDGGSDGGGGD